MKAVGRGIVAVAAILLIVVATYFLLNGFSPNSVGSLQIGINGIITHTDGTTRTFTASSPIIQLLLEGGDPIKGINSIFVNITATPTYYGALTTYTSTGTLTLQRGKLGQGFTATLSTDSFETPGSQWSSGTKRGVYSKTYSPSLLENGLPTETDVAYIYRWSVSFTFSATVNSKEIQISADTFADMAAIHSSEA